MDPMQNHNFRADYEELWERYVPMRDLLIDLVEQWEKCGIYGFICRDQGALVELLAKIAEAKRSVHG